MNSENDFTVAHSDIMQTQERNKFRIVLPHFRNELCAQILEQVYSDSFSEELSLVDI
jgi:hypothetical protein